MAGRSGTDTRRMTGQVLVRLTPELAAVVHREADRYGISAATWIRGQIAKGAEKEVRTKEAIAPVRRHRMPRAPRPEWVLELDASRETLAEVNAALLQAAITAKEMGDGTTNVAIETLIPKVQKAGLRAVKAVSRVCRHIDKAVAEAKRAGIHPDAPLRGGEPGRTRISDGEGVR